MLLEGEDTPEKLDESHVALRDMWQSGQLQEHDYFRGLVALAARWILLGKHEDAVSLVCELTPDFIRYGMPHEMQQDESFRKVAFPIAQALAKTLPDVDEEDVRLALMLVERPVAQA
jgi:hypothetical protein